MKATTEDRERVRADVFRYCPRVVGKFGTDTETSWDCTFGLNMKEGMDDCEFEQYVMNLRNQKRKKNLARSAPPLLFNIPVPLPRNVLLFYTPSAFLLYYAPILAVNLT